MSTTYVRTRQWVQNWLKDKPVEWGQALAMRAALRAMPALSFGSIEWKNQHVPHLYRVLLFNWASCSYRSQDFYDAMQHSANFLIEKKKTPLQAINSSTSIIHSSKIHSSKFRQAEDYAFSIMNSMAAIDANSDNYVNDILWTEFYQDSEYLLSTKNKQNQLAFIKLWHEEPSRSWIAKSENLKNFLRKLHGSRSVWNDWFERRMRGERAAFDIPGDVGHEEDRAILMRLASATDKEFWDRGPAYVNSALLSWIDEAKLRVASLPNELPIKPVALPIQNPRAISFEADEEGKIAIDVTAMADLLRVDEAARDRHSQAVKEARIWLEGCRLSNAAWRLTSFLENYLEAAGEELESTKPSLLVQRGERLRQELARYDVPDHMLPPIADELLLDGKGWQSAHNLLVGLDPVLMASDTAMLGPDRQPRLIAPDEIREKVHEADQAGMLAEGVVEVINETVDLAPPVPDPHDRRTIFSTEMVQNLFIEAFAIALNQPVAASAVVAFGAVVSSGLVAGIVGSVSIMGSIKAAEYLVSHRDWILSRFGNTPTWQTLLSRLADWLESVTPFKPN